MALRATEPDCTSEHEDADRKVVQRPGAPKEAAVEPTEKRESTTRRRMIEVDGGAGCRRSSDARNSKVAVQFVADLPEDCETNCPMDSQRVASQETQWPTLQEKRK